VHGEEALLLLDPDEVQAPGETGRNINRTKLNDLGVKLAQELRSAVENECASGFDP
jgi:hypothetical protein